MPLEYKSFKGQLDGDGEGSIVAEFSIFHERDDVGDISLPSFFVHGQPLPMVHDHDWSIVQGKGIVDVQTKSAFFNGKLFLDTIAGREAYTTMRNLGELQQFSYGYLATDTERGQKNGKPVRYLKSGKIFEVSDTLVGAMPGTRLHSIKSRKGFYLGVTEPPENSYEDISEDVAENFTAQGFAPAGAYVNTIATYPTYAYVCVCTASGEDMPMGEPSYWRVDYTLDDDGDPVLSNPTEVEPGVVFTPTEEPGISFAGQSLKALAAVERLAVRTRALAALRAERKSGRVLSAANHAKLTAVADGIGGHLEAMRSVLAAHAPTPPTDGAKAAEPERLDPRRLWAEFLHLEAKRNGV